MTGFVVPKARATLAIAVGVLCAGQWAEGSASALAAEAAGEPVRGPALVAIENHDVDSVLEIDRTLNTLAPLSRGTAGSDHEGGTTGARFRPAGHAKSGGATE